MLSAFITGIKEFKHSVTTGYPDSLRNNAYDTGREFAHRLTFRKFDY
jgi:hypothetical protein